MLSLGAPKSHKYVDALTAVLEKHTSGLRMETVEEEGMNPAIGSVSTVTVETVAVPTHPLLSVTVRTTSYVPGVAQQICPVVEPEEDAGVPPEKLQFHAVAFGVRSVNAVQKGAHPESGGKLTGTGSGFTVTVTVAVAVGVLQLSLTTTVYVVVLVGLTDRGFPVWLTGNH